MNVKELWATRLKFPVLFAFLGVLTVSIAFSQTYLLMVNEKYSFRIAIALIIAALVYLFVVWINVSDFPYQAQCGFIAAMLIVAGISDSLITPEWLLTAHWLNRFAIFSTNMIATYSAISFLWTRVVTLVYGAPSRAMPITERHEGFIYLCFNGPCAFAMGFIPSCIETDTLFAMRKTLLERSWIFLLVAIGYDFFLGAIVGMNRNKYLEVQNENMGGVVIDVE